jgi:hypothetical protein
MRRLLATVALGLVLCACSAAATPDRASRACDDYAAAIQAIAPFRVALDAKVVKVINVANAVTAPFCAFGSAGAHNAAAMADWARAS